MKNKFNTLSRQQPNLASLTIFNTMVIDGSLSSVADINKWFETLVDKKDYTRGLKDAVLEYSYGLINK